MMWRHLVQQMVQQTARHRVLEVVSDAARGVTARQIPDRNEDSAAPPPRCEIAVLFALGIESGGLVDLLQESVSMRCPNFVEHAGMLASRRIAVAETGVGRKAAALAAEDVVTLHHPSWVISAGFAGALVPGLRRGHILMADEVTDGQHRLSIGLHVDRAALAASPTLHVGRLLTVDAIQRTPADKRELGQRHSALACDMETLGIAEVCQRTATRFLAVRIVSDAVDDELPKEIELLVDQKSTAARLGAATAALWNRPSSLKDMWKLKEDAIRASDRLAKFLVGVIEQLDVAPPAEPSPP